MALSKIVSTSLANGAVSIASISDNTVTSAKLTSTGVVANSYGNTTVIPVITVDAQGRITNATTSSVSGVTGLSYAAANSTVTVSTITTNFDAVVTSGNSTVQGLLKVIDSVSNTSTAIAASANSVTTAYQLAANAVSNATAYAATAYSNAVATAASDATTKAGTAYSNAISYADTAAGTAYSNAVSVASSDATTKAGTAYSNAISYANTAAYTAAGTAYTNAVATAASDATTKAATAYSNATSYADTKAATAYSNVFNGGTFSGAVTVQANLTANSVRVNGNLQVDGDLTVSGNTITLNVTNLNVEDNMIYLNSNSVVTHPDLGFAGNYNDGSYKHAGLFRDATDGVWKFFHGYTPEPDASAFIDTANASFTLSNLQINYVIGNVTGSANSATYLGGNTAATLRSYSDTMAGTAYSNATSYADTKAGTAYSNATSYAATIAGTAYSNATSYAATIAGTAYSNAVAFAANASNISSGTLSASRLPATYLTAESDTLATVTGRGATTSVGVRLGGGTSNPASTTFSHTLAGVSTNRIVNFDGNGNGTPSVWWTSGARAYGAIDAKDPGLTFWTNNGSSWQQQFEINYGNVTINTDIRSPIFYDSNDTGYYVNPNGTSNLWTTNFNSYIDVSSNIYARASQYVLNTAGNGWNLFVDRNGGDGWIVYGGNSVRAPIFYDSNDTTYYADPASTSLFAALTLRGGGLKLERAYASNSIWFNGGTDTNHVLYNSYNGNDPNTRGGGGTGFDGMRWNLYQGIYMSVGSAGQYGGINLTGSGGNTNDHVVTLYGYNSVQLGTQNGYAYASNQMRAPIFYDSNDTAYYIDPNATPLSASFNGNIQINPQSASWAEGIQFYMPTTSTWGGVRWVRNRSNYYGSWYLGWTALDSSNDIVFGTNASGTQVDNILRLYNSTSGSARIGRDLYLYGLTGGNYGNRLIIGNTDTSYTTQDSNIRPTLQLHGAYPVVSLNHTVTTNASHGPTLQFTANGTGRQYVIGMNGQGSFLDIGFSTASDWNPHNGIASYNGTTGWIMDSSGNIFNYISNRSPIYYDSDDTGYYVNPNGGSQLQGHTRFGPYAGSISTGNVTGVEIMNNGGTGDGNVAAISFHCSGTYGVHQHLRNDGYFGVGGWSASNWRWYVHCPSGDMTAAGNVTAYSDPRLKENITPIQSPIEKIKQLNGVRFKWIDSSIIGHPGEYDYGILSTDVEKIAPELVINSVHKAPEGDSYKTVAYDKLVAFTIEAIKEQQKLIEILMEKVKVLESK